MNDIEDFFQGSSGAGIDNDNFTNPGSGEGFDSGSDFVPPPPAPTPSRDRDRNTSQNDDDDDEPDFEAPILPNPFQLSDAEREEQEQRQEAARQLREFQENILDEDSLFFDSKYYVEQNPELDISPADALSHFEDDSLGIDVEYRFLLKEDYTPAPNVLAANYYSGSFFFGGNGNAILFFDPKYYLEQNPEVKATAEVNATVSHAFNHFSEHGISEGREHRYVLPGDFFQLEDAAEDSEDSLSGASANVAGEEQDFDSTMVSESESEPVLDPEVKTARMDFFQDYLTSGIEGSIADADLGLGTTSYISSDEIAVEPSNDSFI